MSEISPFTADHHRFYYKDSPFFPLIQQELNPHREWSNTVLLRLPARLNEDLEWSKEKVQAEQIVASGKHILWEIDFALSSFTFTPENSAAFFAFSLAIEEFTQNIWPTFRNHTLGVVLYQGDFPSEENFPMAYWEPMFLEWVSELKIERSESSYELYRIQMLSEYLHRLVSFLPDSVLPFALFDLTYAPSAARIAQLFSKERFEHIQLVLKGTTYPFSGICWEKGHKAQGYLSTVQKAVEETPAIPLGLYLPKDLHINPLLIAEIDKIIFELNEEQTAFRIIPEEKLTEQWDGIDMLLVPKQAISVQGRRKLLGFIAAGGRIATLEKNELDLFGN